jgi:hypothetical protein
MQFLNITGLTPGAPYAFELLTRSAAGSLALPGSAALPALPVLATPIQCPAFLRVSAVETNSITVDWNLPAPGRPALAYPVRLRLIAIRLTGAGSNGGAAAAAAELDPTTTRHVFKGLETGARCGLKRQECGNSGHDKPEGEHIDFALVSNILSGWAGAGVEGKGLGEVGTEGRMD